MSHARWLWFVVCLPLPAATIASPQLTVILDLHGAQYQEGSIREMESETQRILSQAGLRLDWLRKEDVPPFAQFDNLVLFRFTGNCVVEPNPMMFDERGPLAFTSSSDETVLPFGEVRCDRLRASLQRTLRSSDYERGDILMGRALGRVMAHEVYHMITRDPGHTEAGVAMRALSADELVRGDLSLDREAIARIRASLRRPDAQPSPPASAGSTGASARERTAALVHAAPPARQGVPPAIVPTLPTRKLSTSARPPKHTDKTFLSKLEVDNGPFGGKLQEILTVGLPASHISCISPDWDSGPTKIGLS